MVFKEGDTCFCRLNAVNLTPSDNWSSHVYVGLKVIIVSF